MLIVFDLFGVILSSSFESAKEKLSALLGRPSEIIEPIYRKWEKPFDLGRIDSKAFWNNINLELNTNVNWQKLESVTLDSIVPIEGSFELLEECFKNLDMVLLSNTRKEWYEKLDVKYDFSRFFMEKFLSFELKMSKPDPKIFSTVTETMMVNPEEVIYIDDNMEFIKAAEKIGFNSLLFETPEKTLQYIDTLLEDI